MLEFLGAVNSHTIDNVFKTNLLHRFQIEISDKTNEIFNDLTPSATESDSKYFLNFPEFLIR